MSELEPSRTNFITPVEGEDKRILDHLCKEVTDCGGTIQRITEVPSDLEGTPYQNTSVAELFASRDSMFRADFPDAVTFLISAPRKKRSGEGMFLLSQYKNGKYVGGNGDGLLGDIKASLFNRK